MKRASRPGGLPLELGAVVAEADDHRPRVDPSQRLEQDLHALVLDQLAVVHDGAAVAGEERREPLRVALVRQALLRVARVRRIEPRLGEELLERLGSRGAGLHSSTSTPGGISWTPSTVPQTSRTTLRMCPEPTIVAAAPASASPPQADSAVVAAHRVLELRAVRLDHVAAAAAPRRRARPAARG